MPSHPHLAIIGFGTMGQAICHGLLDAGCYPPERIHPADRHTYALTAQAQGRSLTVGRIRSVVAGASNGLLRWWRRWDEQHHFGLGASDGRLNRPFFLT